MTESVIFRYAIYWFGVCLEHEGRYLGAIDNYCKLRPFTEEGLTLEARYREIICLIQVGKLLEALKNADDFLQLKPLPGSEGQRQAELIKWSLMKNSRSKELSQRRNATGLLQGGVEFSSLGELAFDRQYETVLNSGDALI